MMAETTPKISVIIPVYNAMPYLKETVDSLVNQTYSDFEVLLVDDGSTDDSPAYCDEWAAEDPRFKVFHRPNSGPSRTRNFGLEQASGEYIVFCDSDDTYEKNSLELMVGVMDRYHTDLVLTGYCRFYDRPGVPQQNYRLSKYSLTIMQSVKELASLFTQPATNLNGISIWAKMYRADIIRENNIRFPEDVNYEEDCCFNLLYYRHVQTTGALRDILYRYRQRDVSLSKGYRKDAYPFLVNGFRRRKEFFAELDMQKKFPALETIFFVATTMTYRKIADSDLSREERIEEFRKMLAIPECVEVARKACNSKVRLTRWLARATCEENPAKIDNVLLTWKRWMKVKNVLKRVKYRVKKLVRG